MFCSNCGIKIDENSKFCNQCGAKVNVVEGQVVSKQVVNGNELDRDALKIYLGDVLALECIVNQYARTSATLCNEINTMERNNYYKVYVADQGLSYFYFFYDGSVYYVLTKKNGYSIAYHHGYTDNVWTCIDDILPYLHEKDTWDDFGCGRYSTNGMLYTRKRRKMFQELFISDFEDFKQKAPAEYKKNSSEILMLKKRGESLCKEWDEAKLLLQKLYQVNIIPESFRNDLYAIFYLHNFVTTSNMSFETALLHYNLEEIKAKLDTIIAQQQEIIINQSIMIAQNRELCEQNQKKIGTAC